MQAEVAASTADGGHAEDQSFDKTGLIVTRR